MALPLGGAEAAAQLLQLARGGEVGKGEVELAALHGDVHPDEAPLRRQGQAGLDGVIEQVPQNDAQVQLRDMQLHGNAGIRLHRDVLGPGQGNFAVQNGVGHGVAGLDHRVHGVQVSLQLIQVGLHRLPVTLGGVGLHHLDVAAVVVPPAPHLAVHVLHLGIVDLNKLPLIGGNAPVDCPGKQRHGTPPLYIR